MKKIGFIGMGNMGKALVLGLKKNFEAEAILFTEKNHDKMAANSINLGIRYMESNVELANAADYIVLAVKPQVYPEVLKNIANVADEGKVIISLAPGITIESLKNALGYETKVVRVMPNTPALIGSGMTGISYDEEELSEADVHMVEKIFSSVGKFEVVDEELMDAVVCASGSSPAYVYMFIDSLVNSVVNLGMDRDAATRMVCETVIGASKMVLETGERPETLKDNVCSPNGTTIAAVTELEKNGFEGAIFKATEACFRRSLEFGK